MIPIERARFAQRNLPTRSSGDSCYMPMPVGFHRIRHIGLLTNGHRTEKGGAVPYLPAYPTSEPLTLETYRDRTRLTALAGSTRLWAHT